MMKSDSLTKRNLYILFAISIAAQVFALTLLILLSAFKYIGFDGSSPISGTCTSYYYVKYNQFALLVEISYIFSILCFAAFTAVLILLIKCMMGATKLEDAEMYIPKCMKISLYVLTSVAIMTAIPPFGYYFSTILEFNNCSAATYDSSKLPVIVAIAAVLLLLLIVLIILLFAFFCTNSEGKYREVSSHHTEPNEKVEKAQEVKYENKRKMEKEEPYRKQPEVYEKRTPQEMEKNSPPKRIANRGEDHQHTKENLYSSPSRQPAIHSYSKEVDPRPLLRPTPQKKNQLTKEPAPILQPKAVPYASPSRLPRQNDGELMFHKPRTRGLAANDEEDFSKEQSRYLSKYADRPILSSGIKEINRGNPDGFHRGELPRPENSPSRIRGGREGNLVNYIRGKYAN